MTDNLEDILFGGDKESHKETLEGLEELLRAVQERRSNYSEANPCRQCRYYAEIDNAPPPNIVCVVGWAKRGDREVDLTKPDGHCSLWKPALTNIPLHEWRQLYEGPIGESDD